MQTNEDQQGKDKDTHVEGNLENIGSPFVGNVFYLSLVLVLPDVLGPPSGT